MTENIYFRSVSMVAMENLKGVQLPLDLHISSLTGSNSPKLLQLMNTWVLIMIATNA